MALLDALTRSVGQAFFANPRVNPNLTQNGVPVNDPKGPGILDSFGRPPGLVEQGADPVNARGPGTLVAPPLNLMGDLGIGNKIDIYA